jgi:CDP-diacylglycerol--serine O-phosphatidyltransferase
VSFGVAPGIILYEFGLQELGLPGVVVAALPAICGAIRLARFNVRFDGEKKSYFEGLPIPAQAAAVVVFILVFDDASWFEALERGRLSILVPLVVFLSTLMVTTVPFESVPAPTPRFFRQNPRKGLAFLASFAIVLIFQEEGILVVLAAYLLWGVGRAVYEVVHAAVTSDEVDESSPQSHP